MTVSLWFFSPSSRNYTIYSNAHESLQGNMQSQVLSVHNNNTRDERYSHSFMCHLLPKLSGHVAHRSWMVITVSIKNGVQKSIWLLFKIYNFDFSHHPCILFIFFYHYSTHNIKYWILSTGIDTGHWNLVGILNLEQLRHELFYQHILAFDKLITNIRSKKD